MQVGKRHRRTTEANFIVDMPQSECLLTKAWQVTELIRRLVPATSSTRRNALDP